MSAKRTTTFLGLCLALAATALILTSTALASYEITSFDGGVYEQNGEVATQAGSHPAIGRTVFTLSTHEGSLRNTVVKLPPGLIGNPLAAPACPAVRGVYVGGVLQTCPAATQVGLIGIRWAPGTEPANQWYPVYRMETPHGTPALFQFSVVGVPIYVTAKVRTGEDYGVTVSTLNTPTFMTPDRVKFVFWGVPADPTWDPIREGCTTSAEEPEPRTEGSPPHPTSGCPVTVNAPLKPFLTLPTSCTGPVDTFLHVDNWESEGDDSFFESHDNTLPTPNPIGSTGCNTLDFSPTLEARPTTNVADSPSGLDVDLHVPQDETCEPGPPVHCENAEANLRDTTVTLPEGMTINPSAANGLGACSESQFGFTSMEGEVVHTTAGPAECPDFAKLGTVEIDTPVLENPLPGAVYIAKSYENPFGSLLALYITVNDPVSGIVVKLAGKVEANPSTGQLTATFSENPQLPFEDFHLRFFGGAGGSLRTPSACKTYSTESSLTPWSAPDSGPPATPRDEWAIEQGPGGTCAHSEAERPSAASFDAGTVSPIAGASSPLVVNLRREDGSQQFRSLTLTPPEGLVGKLAGIPYCPEAALKEAEAKTGSEEEAHPSCPAASYVGSVTAAAGAGPAPYHAPGKAYLTGPYKGAPLSLAIVTPATAGPFDLGTIVVRTALYVNRTTTQITAVSDSIPTILQGIPLDVRSIQVKLDRPNFTLNPTSCDPTSFGGQLMSVLGQTTPLQSRFQVGECGRLGFKPSLSLSLKGGIKRNGYPALIAVLQPRAGDANLASISVALPHSEFLAQEHIRTVCTRVQFAANECPEASIYGTATVTTPLLDYPLTGPVYLRSSDNLLPDLVPDLRGPANQPIELEADGRTDSFHGGIRNTFDFVPDAPFTKLTLQLQGGKKGLLVNSRGICKTVNRATVKYTAHNGATYEAHPALAAQCPKAKEHKRSHGRRSAG